MPNGNNTGGGMDNVFPGADPRAGFDIGQFAEAVRDACIQRDTDYLVTERVTKDQIHFYGSIEENIEELIGVIKSERFGTEFGPRGATLIGPAGVGKTLSVMYVATETGAELRMAPPFERPAEIHDFMQFIRTMYEKTEKKQLVLLEEADKYSNRHNIVDPKDQAIVNQWSIEIDSTYNNRGLFFLATTNFFKRMDSALTRWKRLGGMKLKYFAPDEKARYEIMKIIAYNLSASRFVSEDESRTGHSFNFRDQDLEKIAVGAFGYNGDDLYGLLSTAALKAEMRDTGDVTYEDLSVALSKGEPSILTHMPIVRAVKKLDTLKGLDDHIGLISEAIGPNFNQTSEGVNFLLSGPPGVGKSALPEAFARELGINFIYFNGGSMIEGMLGKTGQNIEVALDAAEAAAPSIVLLDEAQELFKTTGYSGYKDTWTGGIRARLNNPMNGVILFATVPPSAITGAQRLEKQTRDRFQYELVLNRPSWGIRKVIFDTYIKEFGFDYQDLNPLDAASSPDVDQTIQQKLRGVSTVDFTGREIERVCYHIHKHGVRRPTLALFADVLGHYADLVRKSQEAGNEGKYHANHVDIYRIIKKHRDQQLRQTK